MDDMISRQAAIDALDKVAEMFPYRIPGKTKTYRQYNEAWSDAIDAAENALEALPSAQPGWIPCKERLPEKDGEYLTTTEDGLYDVEHYGDGEWYYDDVVAWMPFPEWKGEDDD